jgi:hypothetical protein
MIKTIVLISILLYTVECFAQKQNYTISGNVKDENAGESLNLVINSENLFFFIYLIAENQI